jgi:lipopolysaccharide biosynthesis protein
LHNSLKGEKMLNNLRDYWTIKKSGLFDPVYYLMNYPDVRRADIDPLMHFIRFGWKEERNPSSSFDTSFYLNSYTDVKNAHINPLLHFIRYGKKEGRYISLEDLKSHSIDQEKSPYEIIYLNYLNNAITKKSEEYVEYNSSLALDFTPKIKLIAFYLPQFHPIPENDLWWGKGFTEWTNVSKAVPQFLGHYQPHLPGELGFYDLRVPEVQRRQVELAKQYGIYGFCFHYYWFNGKRLLEKPLERFINDPQINFPFCICWANENWSRRWDGSSDEILIAQEHSFEYDKKFIYDFVKLASNPRYIHIGERPLLIIYKPDILKDSTNTFDYWRQYSIEQGIGNPYIIAAQTFCYEDPRMEGFDGAVEFPPHNGTTFPEITNTLSLLNQEYHGRVFRYEDYANAAINRMTGKPYKWFNTIFPGWDNEPRRPGSGLTFEGSTPDIYGKWLEAACQFTLENQTKEEQIVFINAWNEWAEGAYLEPDRRFGYAYLQKTYDVLINISNLNKDNVIFKETTGNSGDIAHSFRSIAHGQKRENTG